MQGTELVRRSTPLCVLADIDAAARRYEALGMRRIDTEDAGCVGYRAGDTGVILATDAFMRGDYDGNLVDRMLDRSVDYLHVASADDAAARLPADACVLQDVHTRAGTREILVEQGGGLLILAETAA